MIYEDYKILNSLNINLKRKRRKSIESSEEDDYKTPGKSSDRVPVVGELRITINFAFVWLIS
jgi:hypothetical protein